MAKKRSKINPKYKTEYRVRNWSEYDRGLVDCGDVTVWLSPAAIEGWVPAPTGERGAPPRYSDAAIETALAIRLVFSLGWRQTEGFVRSLLRMLELELPAPDHTTLSRRSRTLDVDVARARRDGPIHLIVDSTGLKVFGQGEWATRKHGATGSGWRKLHLGVDATGTIVAAELTDSDVADASAAPDLIDQVDDELVRFTADGAYDRKSVYDQLAARGARAVIPPRRDAVVSDGDLVLGDRDAAVQRIAEVGRRAWEAESDYRQQGRAENTIGRYKRLFGGRLRSRDERGQRVEVMVACRVLNRMLELGAARSFATSAA